MALGSSNIGPAIAIVGNSRIGKLSGGSNTRTSSTSPEEELNLGKKIKAGDLTEKDDSGNTAQDQREGDRTRATTSTDAAQQSAITNAVQDPVNQALSSRLQEIRDTKFPNENPVDPGFTPQQQPGMDPMSMMMTGLANRNQDSKPHSQAQRSQGSQAQNKQLQEQMQKMSDKFSDAFKQRDEKIREIAQARNKGPEKSYSPEQINDSVSKIRDSLTQQGTSDIEKATARNKVLENLNQGVIDNLKSSETGQKTLDQVIELFGGKDKLNEAYKSYRRTESEVKSPENNLTKTNLTEEYDDDNSFSLDALGEVDIAKLDIDDEIEELRLS